MKLFNSANIDVINNCIGGTLTSNYTQWNVVKKGAKFERKFADHKNLHRYFGICAI